jgi:hypothetical protein
MPKINCDEKGCEFNKNCDCSIDILSLVDGQCEFLKAFNDSINLNLSKKIDAIHKDMASGSYLDQMEDNYEARGN